MTARMLIGYWPLLEFTTMPGIETSDVDNVAEQLSAIDIPIVKGVLWIGDNDGHVPIFIMDRAIEVAEHLDKWCEGDYNRFKIYFEQRDNGYAVALIPDPKMSIERWKLARLMHFSDIVIDNDFTVCYKILGTCCINGTTYRLIKDKLGKSIRLGFIDFNDVNKNDISKTDFSKIKLVGPFAIGNVTEGIREHMDELFNSVDGPQM